MEDKSKLPLKPFHTRGGVKAPHRKHTAECESVIMPPPNEVIICMSQHIGAPCKPVVKAGDVVKVGQLIGDSDAFVSVPMHSSVSGKVKKIETVTMPNGTKVQAVRIESDGLMTPFEGIAPPNINSREDFIRAVRDSGVVGLGGAGFPVHVKLSVEKDKVDTLIINAAECEPYITADNREALENSWGVISGIKSVMELMEIDTAIIAIESNKPKAIKVLQEVCTAANRDMKGEVCVLPLKARYPQGAEKVIIKACTNRVVPEGKLPADVGCVVMNIGSVAFIASYLKTGMPLITKRITVDGQAVNRPQNVIVPIGTKIKDIIEFCGGYKEQPEKLIFGGPMMGLALPDDEMPLLKQNNAVLAFSKKEAAKLEPSDCIRCGRCASACPMGLVPPRISGFIKQKDIPSMLESGLMVCMECGCCSFVCPANRPIVQNMRLGKSIVRNSKKN
ncbi:MULTISPECIES: electron transport complex subunit RsxC [unclassified Ruminococcus]|uniref:electron transport complex subunit RsxC n=1 Tax=unclassified Ruminococcus TaxID=2608920 RepID=UPI00210CDE7C|nr:MULTISPECIES: electron transport complex subunit RsxC [unclassified Ruminococcus]